MTNFIPAGGSNQGGWRAVLQKLGGNLAGMVIPNIGAFIAWGLLTALFIPTGWTPNEEFSKMVGPMIVNLLPILIGYTGGKMVHGHRGGVIAAVATVGVIVGSTIPMFLGAMIIGPLSAWLLKQVDKVVEPRIPVGFEMLINNFTLGILGLLLAMAGFAGVGPVVTAFSDVLGNGVESLVALGLLPLASIIIEPAKILFLNNAINHGVLGPLGVAQAESAGRSILFMLESNPGPGLGLLVAMWLVGPKVIRGSAPGAIIIHFLGGIHEIYFPYVLMKPKTLLAMIAGGATGVATFVATGAGLVATPSPGSIFAYIAMTPKDASSYGIYLGIALSAAVTFVVAWLLLRGDKDVSSEGEFEAAKAKAKDLKAGN
ncbi:MAG: mannitol-specific PTS transporter subunit IIC [Micrococcales bacterium]